jgi:hypothetical protein
MEFYAMGNNADKGTTTILIKRFPKQSGINKKMKSCYLFTKNLEIIGRSFPGK